MSAAAIYVYDEHRTEQAARKQAATLPGAVVKHLKDRARWVVLVPPSDARDRANVISFEALRDTQQASADHAALVEAERSAEAAGRSHIVQHGLANYESYRFNFRKFADYQSEKPTEWHIHGVLPKAEIAVIYGAASAGKSTLALDMAAAIGAGREWCGRQVTKGHVFIFAAEAAKGLKFRVRALKAAHPDIAEDDLPRIEGASLNLCDPKDVAELVRTLNAQGPPALLIIDVFASAFVGNENSAEDVGLAMRHCRFLHEKTGATVCLIAHAGKQVENGIRGSSAIRAAADCEIEVTRSDDVREWRVSKMREGSDEGIRGQFKLEAVKVSGDDPLDAQTACVVRHFTAPVRTAKAQRRRPRGNALLVLQHMEAKHPSDAPTIAELHDEIGAQIECKRDGRRLEYLRSAIQQIADTESNKWLWRHAGDRVSLSSTVSGADSEAF